MDAFLGVEVLRFICSSDQNEAEALPGSGPGKWWVGIHSTGAETDQQLQTKQGKGQPGPIPHVQPSLLGARGWGGRGEEVGSLPSLPWVSLAGLVRPVDFYSESCL